jgi:hypothetical protein
MHDFVEKTLARRSLGRERRWEYNVRVKLAERSSGYGGCEELG